jgi:hypothetical protein
MNLHCRFGRRVSKRFTVLSAVFAGGLALVLGSVSTYAFVRLQNGVLGLYWANGTNQAIWYTISTSKPCPGVTDGSADNAVRLAFARWQAVPSTSISFQEDSNPNSRARTDWQSPDLHLVWFDTDDSSGMFSQNSGLVAVTPVNFSGDGSITDADIIFNAKDHTFSTTQVPGTFDVQNIATHECGHFLGLDHSAVVGATMNPFAVQQDVRLRSLEKDDVAGASTIYPRPGFTLGSISGQLVTAGGAGISGAHIVAEDASGEPASSTLTTSDGHFQILGLAQGSYTVYAEPLDGPVVGQNLSLGTSHLTINTAFGTTFYGTVTNPTPVFVNTGLNTAIGVIHARAATGITIQGAQPPTGLAGDTVSINAWGAGFQPTDTVVVTGDGFTVQNVSVSTTSITITVKIDPSLPPTLRSIRLVRGSSGDARVLTGGFEVRLPNPVLSGVNPASASPGQSVTLRGSYLNPSGVVIVGEGMVQNPSAAGASVVFPCPNIPNGTYDVTFQNADGQMAALTQALTVTGSQVTVQATPPPSSGASLGNQGNNGNQQIQASAAGGSGTPSGFSGTGGGGGGGGGGGCTLEHESRSPFALAPLILMLLVVIRRRRI